MQYDYIVIGADVEYAISLYSLIPKYPNISSPIHHRRFAAVKIFHSKIVEDCP